MLFWLFASADSICSCKATPGCAKMASGCCDTTLACAKMASCETSALASDTALRSCVSPPASLVRPCCKNKAAGLLRGGGQIVWLWLGRVQTILSCMMFPCPYPTRADCVWSRPNCFHADSQRGLWLLVFVSSEKPAKKMLSESTDSGTKLTSFLAARSPSSRLHSVAAHSLTSRTSSAEMLCTARGSCPPLSAFHLLPLHRRRRLCH